MVAHAPTQALKCGQLAPLIERVSADAAPSSNGGKTPHGSIVTPSEDSDMDNKGKASLVGRESCTLEFSQLNERG
jgi:hypothetical protein